MKGYVDNIEKLTQENEYFRQVLFTGTYCQLVLMSLKSSEEIGLEVHDTVDQFFRVESGEGKIIMDGEEKELRDGDAIIVPAGTEHNLINISSETTLKLYTIYSPPNHPDKKIHKTKEEAMADEEDHV
ncbi:MAG: cupin domain-containing protein [Patescibacteria group bacterium]|nr:cupin domain-containing protein [Patescibacteria group bacterium]